MGQKETKSIYKYIIFTIQNIEAFHLNSSLFYSQESGGEARLLGDRSLECSTESSYFLHNTGLQQ